MTSRLTIAVCAPRPLFTACDDSDARALIELSRAAGHDAEAITLPSPDVDGTFSERGALRWALVDLFARGQRASDVVVCMHPDTLLLRHPHKIAWVRQAWSLSITETLRFAARVVVTDGGSLKTTHGDDAEDGAVLHAAAIADVLDVVCAGAVPVGATR